MQLQGTIKYIGQPITKDSKAGKPYTTQKMLLSVLDGNYTNVFPIDISPKLQDSSDQWSVGQNVKVHINMRGNEYVNKEGNPDAFLSFSAWKVETQGSAPQQQEAPKTGNYSPQPEIANNYFNPSPDNVDDSLPF